MSHLFLSRPGWGEARDAGARGLARSLRGEIPSIFVTSGSDLLASSIVALNVAVDLGLRAIRTTLVDADPAAPIAHILAGLNPASLARDSKDRRPQPLRLLLTPSRALPLARTLGEVAPGTQCAIVNAPARQWLEGTPVREVRIRNLLLVLSRSSEDCVPSFAIAKRVAAGNAGLRLGIVVTDVTDDESGRSLHRRFAAVLERHTGALPAGYCGWLSPGDRVSRSVRDRVPALLSTADTALSGRLRGIAAAASQLFDLGGGGPGTGSESPGSAADPRLGLTRQEIADLRGIVADGVPES